MKLALWLCLGSALTPQPLTCQETTSLWPGGGIWVLEEEVCLQKRFLAFCTLFSQR